eukprot:TRINITY_DN7814_c3_g1_i1.p1 TRINITY_DN7814_c3_g1~~TRINITY_DN7814_c3_g1_i1.p1  ORF type:complete len:618 (+),score=103.03 TRINITY_DN7814_c3_g1_i1:146-1855(+)
MVYYTWSIISTTISIFVAVLMFSGMNVVLHSVLLKGQPQIWHIVANFIQLVVYLLTLQFATAYFSGVFEEQPFLRGRTKVVCGTTLPFTIQEQRSQKMRRMQCWATLLSHMTGFSAISFGGAIQHLEVFTKHRMSTFFVIPFLYIGLVLSGRVFRKMRNHAIHEGKYAGPVRAPRRYSSLATEAADEMHENMGRGIMMTRYEETVTEAMNDVSSLAVSFLTVQACRFNISGVLPNDLGIEESHYVHPWTCSLYLIILSVAFCGCTILLVTIAKRFPEDVTPGTWQSMCKRAIEVARTAAAMAMAWCLLFASKWELARNVPSLGNPNFIKSRVILAIIISMFAFGVINSLDKLADSDHTTAETDESIEHIITAIGILVGFSWEQSFDGGAEVLAERTPQPVVAQLVVAFVVASIVITPWRRHILQTVMDLDEKRKDKEEAKEDEEGGGLEPKEESAGEPGAERELPFEKEPFEKAKIPSARSSNRIKEQKAFDAEVPYARAPLLSSELANGQALERPTLQPRGLLQALFARACACAEPASAPYNNERITIAPNSARDMAASQIRAPSAVT